MLRQPVRTSLSDFIKTTMGSQFVIPVYQRNYTWNPDKETTRFLNDIESLLEGKTTNHFMGIIIYMDTRVSAMLRQLQIVDGQQRMTTAFIFLLALKHIAENKKNRQIAGMIEDYYLFNRHADAEVRLKPAVSTDDVFARLVYGNPKDLSRKEKESNVFHNYAVISSRIHTFLKKYTLVEILNAFARIDVLEFPLSDSDNAQQIFESINSTGAPLTGADLIRNYILMNHPDEVQERFYTMYWQPLEKDYPDPRHLEDFFRYYLAVKTYGLLNRKDIYEGFKKYWRTNVNDVEDGLKDIIRYARYYHVIYEGTFESEKVEDAFADFRVLDSQAPAPFLMEMVSLFQKEEINEAELVSIVRFIDSYLVRRALSGADNSSLSRYFPALLKNVLTSRKNYSDILYCVRDFLIESNKGKSLAMPTDNQVHRALKDINAYSLMHIRAILERIEHHGSHAKVDTSSLNIEHIMPQNPNKWWKKNAGTIDEEDYTYTTNLIGNLTLCATYDNSRMGNENFDYKKKILKKTMHIRMNTEIIEKTSWTKEDILKRCDALTREIIEIWPYSIAFVRKKKEVKAKKNNETRVSLNVPTVTAQGILYEDGKLEVQAGSLMKPYAEREMKKMKQLFAKLNDEGVLSDVSEGRVAFNQSYLFADADLAAGFLMHRGGHNAEAWRKEETKEEKEKTTPEKKRRAVHKKSVKKEVRKFSKNNQSRKA